MEKNHHKDHNIIPEQDQQETEETIVDINRFDIEQRKFKPHFGNNCVFLFVKGEPLITIGPHCIKKTIRIFHIGPLSLCLAMTITLATYFVCTGVTINKHWFFKIVSFGSGVNLLIMFLLTALKNPGIRTSYSYRAFKEGDCKACSMPKDVDVVHCYDCDICIKGHDHHCPWTGKCIGEGNIQYFQLFLCAFMVFFIANIAVIII